MSKSGFVSILGQPNVGKSTLLNRLVGAKLAAVSKKPQTTRQVIRGILTERRGQVVFLDTPGLHRPKNYLGKFMIREATKTFYEADLFYWMVEPVPPRDENFEFLRELKRHCEEFHQEDPSSVIASPEGAKQSTSPEIASASPLNPTDSRTEQSRNRPGFGAASPGTPPRNDKKIIFCVINKTDSISKPDLLPIIDRYQKEFPFTEIIPISALTGDQVGHLLEETFKYLTEHEPYFPLDITSDQSERFLASEMIREKIFHFTSREIPYSTTVQIDEFKEEESIIRIEAVIFTEKDSQKGILIGAKGQKMKEIGQAAREDLERFFGKKVFLKLWVKALKNWKKDEQYLKRLGLQ